MNKKAVLVPSIVAGAVGTAAFLLKDEDKRDRFKQSYQRYMAKMKGKTEEAEDEKLNEKVGYSDPEDIEDNRMVSEGSQYSVHHFNKAQEENEQPLETTMNDK